MLFSKKRGMKRASGRFLTAIALNYGLKRRWWGLEPDFLLRPRLLALMQAPPYTGAARNHPRVKVRRFFGWLRKRSPLAVGVVCVAPVILLAAQLVR